VSVAFLIMCVWSGNSYLVVVRRIDEVAAILIVVIQDLKGRLFGTLAHGIIPGGAEIHGSKT